MTPRNKQEDKHSPSNSGPGGGKRRWLYNVYYVLGLNSPFFFLQ